MSDTDLEMALGEIRARVRAHIRSQSLDASLAATEPRSENKAALDSVMANLSVMQRSWNKLPPLTSYRKGWVARLELWCKRILKRMTHWFTWEQVNFNSATSNSVQSSVVLLTAHDEALSDLRKELDRVQAVVARLEMERQMLPKNGDVSAVPQRSLVKDGSSLDSVDKLLTSQSPLIDVETEALVKRIRELRALKGQFDESL